VVRKALMEAELELVNCMMSEAGLPKLYG